MGAAAARSRREGPFSATRDVMIIFAIIVVMVWLRCRHGRQLPEAVAGSALLWCAVLFAYTEISGWLGCWHRLGAWLFWGGCALAVTLAAVAEAARQPLGEVRLRIDPPPGFRLATWLIAGLLLLELAWGVLMPPSNYDSMSYHLARIPHWINQGHIGFYDTCIQRQNFQMPLAEVILANLLLLHHGSDRWVNFLQFFALAGSLAIVYGLVRQSGGSRAGGWLAAGLAATLPMAICQSTTTQNDLVAAFFLLLSIDAIFRFIRAPEGFSALRLGVATGLALLTKATLYPALLPFLLLLPAQWLRSRPSAKTIGWLVLASGLAFAFNLPHLARNRQFYGHWFGPASGEHLNGSRSVRLAAINVFRHAATELTLPINPLNRQLSRVLNRLFGPDLAHPDITLPPGHPFALFWAFDEDSIPNTPQFGLFLLTLALLLPAWRRGRLAPAAPQFILALTAAMLLTAVLLRWQPWISRLHLPLLLAATVASGIVLPLYCPEKWLGRLLLLLAVAGFGIFVLRHYVLQRNLIKKGWGYPYHTREAMRFVSDRDPFGVYQDYWRAVTLLPGAAPIGLACAEDGMEYPLSALYREHHGAYPRLVPLAGRRRGCRPVYLCVLRSGPADSAGFWQQDYDLLFSADRIQVYRLRGMVADGQ